jgi:hypothetical protein
VTKEEKYKKIIQQAAQHLAGYRSPSLTKRQQREALADCWELLAPVAFGCDDDDDHGTEACSSPVSQR